MNPRIAVIGGTGICDPSLLANAREIVTDTPYGATKVYVGNWEDTEVTFLPRHGSTKAGEKAQHHLPPHKINYQANIWALKELGIDRIIGTAATGSLNPKMKPGSFVLLTQFMDFTKSRQTTFYDEGTVYHLDMTEPYCPEIRKALLQSVQEESESCHPSATYVCTEGPRFETPAEIKAFKMLGGDLAGMTNVPEVVLAKELEMCYASIAIVTNMAAGITEEKLAATEVEDMMKIIMPKLTSILKKSLDKIPAVRNCLCKDALKEAKA